MEEGFPASVVNITSGWFSEDSVAEIVTDLFDSTNDAADADTISLSLAEMTKALTVDVKDTPVATTIFSLMASLNTSNSEQSGQIRSLLEHHDIALDGPATDVYGINESKVNEGVTSKALPIFTEVPVDGEPIRICQDKLHIGSFDGVVAGPKFRQSNAWSLYYRNGRDISLVLRPDRYSNELQRSRCVRIF